MKKTTFPVLGLLILFDILDRWSAKENGIMNLIIICLVGICINLFFDRISKRKEIPQERETIKMTIKQLYNAFVEYRDKLLIDEEYEGIKEIDNILSQLELGIVSESVHKFDFVYDYGEDLQLNCYIVGKK